MYIQQGTPRPRGAQHTRPNAESVATRPPAAQQRPHDTEEARSRAPVDPGRPPLTRRTDPPLLCASSVRGLSLSLSLSLSRFVSRRQAPPGLPSRHCERRVGRGALKVSREGLELRVEAPNTGGIQGLGSPGTGVWVARRGPGPRPGHEAKGGGRDPDPIEPAALGS